MPNITKLTPEEVRREIRIIERAGKEISKTPESARDFLDIRQTKTKKSRDDSGVLEISFPKRQNRHAIFWTFVRRRPRKAQSRLRFTRSSSDECPKNRVPILAFWKRDFQNARIVTRFFGLRLTNVQKIACRFWRFGNLFSCPLDDPYFASDFLWRQFGDIWHAITLRCAKLRPSVAEIKEKTRSAAEANSDCLCW